MAIHENCHLIAVMGGKGGVGKSMFAANLAAAFIMEMRAPTLLIDLDSKSCGDQNIITGLRPTKTVADLATFSGALTSQTATQFLAKHPSGLMYLGAVLGPEQTLTASPELLRKQLYPISQNFRYIVVDLGCDLNPLQLAMIEDASSLMIVTTPEVLVVNQTKRLLNDLQSATIPGDLLQVVLNKVTKSGLDPRAISQSLGKPLIGMIPQDDITAYSSLQRSMPFVLSSGSTPIAAAYHDIVRKLSGGVLQKLKAMAKPKLATTAVAGTPGGPALQAGSSDRPSPLRKRERVLDSATLMKLQTHSELIKEMEKQDLKRDMSNINGDPQKEKELRTKTQRVITQIVDRTGTNLSREERSRVIKDVLDEALGLGPLEDLLADPTVSEIMVNGCDKIYMEKGGKVQLSNVTFTSNLQLRNVIERIVTPLGRRIDEKTPYVDARLVDGSRVNAVIEPLAIDGPTLTIRKFPQSRITFDDYVTKFNSLTKPMSDFLRICVEQGLNVIISGGTGTGKTTLLNALSGFIPANERIITVEDAAELQLKQEHVVRLETRPANMEGTGEITIRDLIRNTLRMRPDRIIVGECRDGAALDMLSAMNTGHDGSMTTVHSNNPREAIARLETLCLMAGMDLPARAIREQIAGAVDLIIQISRLSDGSRRITSITEVVGMQGEAITLQEVFRFKEEGFDKNRKIVGQFQAMGLIPTFIEKFEQRGVMIPRNLFTSGADAAQQQAATGTSGPAPARPRVLGTSVTKKPTGGSES